jgi:hemolysin activation/secretion protein
MTVAQLIDEAGKISALYQDRGYLLPFALLQSQDFQSGLIEVTIVECYADQAGRPAVSV